MGVQKQSLRKVDGFWALSWHKHVDGPVTRLVAGALVAGCVAVGVSGRCFGCRGGVDERRLIVGVVVDVTDRVGRLEGTSGTNLDCNNNISF